MKAKREREIWLAATTLQQLPLWMLDPFKNCMHFPLFAIRLFYSASWCPDREFPPRFSSWEVEMSDSSSFAPWLLHWNPNEGDWWDNWLRVSHQQKLSSGHYSRCKVKLRFRPLSTSKEQKIYCRDQESSLHEVENENDVEQDTKMKKLIMFWVSFWRKMI